MQPRHRNGHRTRSQPGYLGRALAYVADDVPPARADTAMWMRPGSVTVRAPDGTSRVWAHDTGLQTIGWAGDTLLVEHDRSDADTEGFEELMLYRGPGDRTVLTEGLVAISPDGTRLLLAGGNGDHMLDLYDVDSRRIVSSISIADYERALAPASELAGVDLSRWPGFEEPLWPISCCGNSPPANHLARRPSCCCRRRATTGPDDSVEIQTDAHPDQRRSHHSVARTPHRRDGGI